MAAWAPEDRILVETDSPFLAPVPFRGKPNEPAYVTHVAAQVARPARSGPGAPGRDHHPQPGGPVRLAALFLSGAIGLLGPQALLAQASSTLPWRAAPALPWQMEEPGPPPAPCAASPTQTSFGLTVHLAQDGAVRLTDQKGLIRLRAGLPGRVGKASKT